MGSVRIDETGNMYGQLTVVGFSHTRRTPNGSIKVLWRCRCSCGETRIATGSDLRRKDVRAASMCYSCAHRGSHGHTAIGRQSPTYVSWNSMHNRVKRHRGYEHLKICRRWYLFANFLEDMGERPGPEYSIERRDNRKGYFKRNCCWATNAVQSLNKRSTRRVTINGKTQPLKLWLQELGVPAGTYYDRRHRGWSRVRALTHSI